MIIYICPKCKRPSKTMKLLKNSRYNKADENIKTNHFAHISHELLRCKCGILLTWFDMIEQKEKPPGE